MKTGLSASFIKRYAAGPVVRADQLRTTGVADVTVLFGASGSGKTTILRCIAGLERPDEGEIRFNGKVWSDTKEQTYLPARLRNVGLVSQDYSLFPHMTVARNVAYGLDGLEGRARRRRVTETLDWVGLTGLERRLPRDLSGGQQQRVALARAMARRPQLLLLDEPLSALDAPTRQRLRGELRELLRHLGIPTMLVTHDREEALALGDGLVVMSGGEIVQQGRAQNVFSRPDNLAVASILAIETIQPGHIIHVTDDLIAVEVNGIRLLALARELPAGTRDVFACIRAEDVILTVGEDFCGSPRNRLAGVVREITRDGPLVRVALDCGFPLLALLTKQACQELALREGDTLHAVLKAPHIHLIPRG